MLVKVALVAVVGFLAGAVAAAEPWDALGASRPDATLDVRREVVFLAGLRWLDSAGRGLELGRARR